ISIKKSPNFEKTFFAVFRETSKSIVQKNSKISRKRYFHENRHNGYQWIQTDLPNRMSVFTLSVVAELARYF
ncbi:hypothetical protein T4C_3011, partial [Trichinella pseudospiralis]